MKVHKREQYEYSDSKRIEKFKFDYGVEISQEQQVIDLSDTRWFSSQFSSRYILKDISRIELDKCEKLILPLLCKGIEEFKPKMKNLKFLDMSSCEIKSLKLDPVYFPSLESLYLIDNKIKVCNDIKIISEFPSLKYVYLHKNPIVKSNKELFKLFDLLKNKNKNINVYIV